MNNIVRAFVVILALTGATASTQTISSTSTQIKVAVRTIMPPVPTRVPVPTCPPNDKNACGWGQQ